MKKYKGFTLIEIVIIVAIIGILIAIAIPKFIHASKLANNRRIETNARNISSIITTYYLNNKNYPESKELINNVALEDNQNNDILNKAGIKAKDQKYYGYEVIESKIIIMYNGFSDGFTYQGKAINAFNDKSCKSTKKFNPNTDKGKTVYFLY